MTEVVVTTGNIRRAKLQSNHHQQQTNTQLFLQAGCPSCRPTNSVRVLKEMTNAWSDSGYWHQRADERHGNPPQGNRKASGLRIIYCIAN